MIEPEQNRALEALNADYLGLFTVYLTALQKRLPDYKVIVTETGRTKERQEFLKAKGASKTMHSNHLLGKAVDIALLDNATGQIDWSDDAYKAAYALCDPRRYGLVSGGQLWDGFDYPHLEVLDEQAKYPALVGSPEDVWLT